MSFITSPGVIVPPLTAGGVAYGTGSQAKVTSAGTVGQVLTSAGAGVPVFATVGANVTSFSGASTGLTPSTATTGAVSLAGTLAVGSGGTSLTTLTANNVILGNGASAPTFVAPGTSGNFLTSNGTTWQSTTPPAASVSGLTLITTLTASNSASLTFTNTSITTTYDNYLFVFSSLRAASQGSVLFLQTSTDNGSTFASTAADYAYAWQALDVASGSAQYQNSIIDTAIKVGYLVDLASVGNVPQASFNGQVYMVNPLKAADTTQFVGQVSAYGFTRTTTAFGGGSRVTAQANNAIKFFFDAGNISSGTIQIFGVQKS